MQNIREFLANLTHAASVLGQFEKEFDKREAKLLEIVQHAENAVKIELDDSYGPGIRRYMNELIDLAGDATTQWQQQVTEQIEQTEFISKFDESVIAMAYGKVNCGKSTLGNLVAGRSFAGSEANPYENVEPKFEVHHSVGGELKTRPLEDGFSVGGTECTKEIQTFTLGGLSWVDSPGIHSMTGENQALAKRYVDSAELVIYLMNSDSVARSSDIAELRELMKVDKPTLIGVIQFDEVDVDVDLESGEIVETLKPKSDKAKEEQREHIEERISEVGLQDILRNRSYCFLSAKVAQKAIDEGDRELWEASGYPQFLQELGSIVSDDAILLKQENPKRKFNKMIIDIWGGTYRDDNRLTLANLKGELRERVEDIRQKREELEGLGETIVIRTKNRAIPKIEALIRKFAREMEEQIDEEDEVTEQIQFFQRGIGEKVEEIVAEAYEKELRRAVAQNFRDVMKKVDGIHFGQKIDIPNLKILTEKIEASTKTRNGGIGAAVGGTAGGFAGVKLGSVIGTMIGGPLGTLIGGIVGASVGFVGGVGGKKVGEAMAGTTTINAMVGANAEDVIDAAFEQLDGQVKKAVDRELKDLAKKYLRPIQQSLSASAERIDELETRLLALRYSEPEGNAGERRFG